MEISSASTVFTFLRTLAPNTYINITRRKLEVGGNCGRNFLCSSESSSKGLVFKGEGAGEGDKDTLRCFHALLSPSLPFVSFSVFLRFPAGTNNS